MTHTGGNRGQGKGKSEETASVGENAKQAAQSVDGADNGDGAQPGAEAAVEQEHDLAAQYLDALQRERASFINYRRRAEQERAEFAQYAADNLLKKLLPVVDDFDRALQAIPEVERENNRWVEGVELIARKLHTILEQEGVQTIDAQGEPFDPNLHEAVAFEDRTAESADGDHGERVAEVFNR